MKGVITLEEFKEGLYALCVRPEDKEPLIEFFETSRIKHHPDVMRYDPGTIYVDFYVEEVCVMGRGFYESEDYTIIEAADFLAANGFDGVVEPAVSICCDTLDAIL